MTMPKVVIYNCWQSGTASRYYEVPAFIFSMLDRCLFPLKWDCKSLSLRTFTPQTKHVGFDVWLAAPSCFAIAVWLAAPSCSPFVWLFASLALIRLFALVDGFGSKPSPAGFFTASGFPLFALSFIRGEDTVPFGVFLEIFDCSQLDLCLLPWKWAFKVFSLAVVTKHKAHVHSRWTCFSGSVSGQLLSAAWVSDAAISFMSAGPSGFFPTQVTKFGCAISFMSAGASGFFPAQVPRFGFAGFSCYSSE